MRWRFLVVLPAVLLYASSVHAQPPQDAGVTERELLNTRIRELIDMTNGEKTARQLIDRIFAVFEKAVPNVPADLWKKFRSEIKISDFTEMAIPIYAKHFTREDIEGLIQFYKTPLGRKLLEKQPAIAQESVTAGMLYGQMVAAKVVSKLTEKGYKVPASLKI